MKYNAFLKWWLIFTVILISCFFANHYGLFKEIWQKDSSYLSFATLGIFLVISIKMGFDLFDLCNKSQSINKSLYEDFCRKEEVGWFFSELCLNLGMLGTIIGFVMMLSGFDGLNISDQKTIQSLLSELGKSMATALYTTLVGLICGQLLKLQTFILSLQLNKFENQLKEKEVS